MLLHLDIFLCLWVLSNYQDIQGFLKQIADGAGTFHTFGIHP